MASLASINIKFQVDLKDFSTEMQTALRSIDKFGQKMQSVGRGMSAAITLPVLAAGGAAIKLASDYEESLNKVNVAFGGSSTEVKDFAKTTLQSFGIAEGTALDMASTFGDMGTSLGLSTQQASKMSTSLVGLAGDLSSFKNIGIDQANTALSGIFTGETESLKKLGIVMTEANLQSFAYSQGIQTNIKDMDQASKVQLRYNYIMSVTKNAQGDFARTSGGAANQMRIFQESMKQLGQQFGSIILPAFTGVVQKLNGLITAFGQLSPETKKIIVIVAGLAAAIGPLLFAMGAVASAIPAITAGFAALTGPVGLVIAALAAVAYVVIDNWDVIKKYLVDIANYFVDLYNNSIAVRTGVEYVIFAFKTLWTEIKSVGKLLAAVFTFDISGVKKALSEGFNEVAVNAKKAFDNVMGGKMKKITISKDKVETKGVENAVSDATEKGVIGGVKKAGKKVKRADIAALDLPDIKQKSVGTISSYDEEISKLKRFRDEVATTAEQIKLAEKGIAELEFARDLKFDPSKIITPLEETGTMIDRLKGHMAGMATVSQGVSQSIVSNIAESALPALTDAFSQMGEGMVAAMGLAEHGFQGFVGGLVTTITKLISMMLASSISQAIAGASASGAATGPAAIFTTPAFIATAVGGVIAAFAAIPKFETGGIVGGSSYYGDKIMARVNSGELILNQGQQAKIFGMLNQPVSGGGASVIIPEVTIKGQDLLVVFDRANKRKDRIG